LFLFLGVKLRKVFENSTLDTMPMLDILEVKLSPVHVTTAYKIILNERKNDIIDG